MAQMPMLEECPGTFLYDGMAVGDAITLGRLELMAYPAKVREVLTRAGLNADLFAPDAPQTGYLARLKWLFTGSEA